MIMYNINISIRKRMDLIMSVSNKTIKNIDPPKYIAGSMPALIKLFCFCRSIAITINKIANKGKTHLGRTSTANKRN